MWPGASSTRRPEAHDLEDIVQAECKTLAHSMQLSKGEHLLHIGLVRAHLVLILRAGVYRLKLLSVLYSSNKQQR
jgi:hypothetical protein